MIEQRTDEWKAQRLGKVTASRIVDILPGAKGNYLASRRNYMAELICERLTGQPTEHFISPAMQWGIDTEPLARSAYEVQKDVMVEEAGFIDHPSISDFGGSPDGLVGRDGGIEIKCPNTATHIDTLLGAKIDRAYFYQMHALMMCTGRIWWDYFSYDPRLPDNLSSHWIRVYKEPDTEKMIEAELNNFLRELEAKMKKLEEL